MTPADSIRCGPVMWTWKRPSEPSSGEASPPHGIEFTWAEGEGFVAMEPASRRSAATPAAASPRSIPGKLALLVAGMVLGAALGLITLIVQGQRQARADLEPVIALQQLALVRKDAELYRSGIDPADPSWSEALLQTLSGVPLSDADTTPQVRRVYLQGEWVEVEVAFTYQGRSYRRLESLRRVEGRWRLARPPSGTEEPIPIWEGEALVLRATPADAALAEQGPRLDALAAAFCARYDPPPPCRIELTIAADGALLPLRPGAAATPMPPLLTYQAARVSDRLWVTLGLGREERDPLSGRTVEMIGRERIRRAWPRARDLRQLLVVEQSPPEAAEAARIWLRGSVLPVQMVSPRYVGLHKGDPHPLWWLAVAETMGDVVLRRALGAVTGEAAAVFTLWAAARGDVAVWAERWTGVRLPPTDIRLYADETEVVGLSVWRDAADQRAAARDLALLLHVRYGETALLAWLLGHGDTLWTATEPRLGERTPEQLAAEWQAWVEACQVQGRCGGTAGGDTRSMRTTSGGQRKRKGVDSPMPRETMSRIRSESSK